MTRLLYTNWDAASSSKWVNYLPEQSSNIYSDNVPFIVADNFSPLEEWNSFLREYSNSVSARTIKEYARDLNRFANYLEQNSETIHSISEHNLAKYRDSRLESGISTRSWQKEVVTIRNFFNYLVEKGILYKVPWTKIGRYSVVHPRATNEGFNIRMLTRQQWDFFLRVGLKGETPDGSIDDSRRVRKPQRDATAALLALTTGMRIQEWSHLLVSELESSVHGAQIELQATAKGNRFRSVFVPSRTVEAIDKYLAIERATTIRNAQDYLRDNLDNLAIVHELNLSQRRISYELKTRKYKRLIREIPVEHRLKLVKFDGYSIEPQALFLNQSGLGRNLRSWHQTFKLANMHTRMWEEGQALIGTKNVTSHDLRHTFAVVILQSLQKKAISEMTSNHQVKPSLTQHFIHNPLLQVQRLLGHASPETTMNYLRYIDDSEVTIHQAFEEWNDPLKSYSDYLSEANFN